MEEYGFNVNIQAKDNGEAAKIVAALIDLKKLMTTEDLLLFVKKVKADPKLIQRAKLFI